MENTKKKHLITSALPYANGPLHIGHLAGAYLPADIYARFLRMNGEDVAFICGSDEHGAAITLRAKKEDFFSLCKAKVLDFKLAFDLFYEVSCGGSQNYKFD